MGYLISIFRTLKAHAMMFECLVHFQASNSQEKHRFTLQVAVKAAVAKMQDQKIKVALARSTETANHLGIVDQKMCSDTLPPALSFRQNGVQLGRRLTCQQSGHLFPNGSLKRLPEHRF